MTTFYSHYPAPGYTNNTNSSRPKKTSSGDINAARKDSAAAGGQSPSDEMTAALNGFEAVRHNISAVKDDIHNLRKEF